MNMKRQTIGAIALAVTTFTIHLGWVTPNYSQNTSPETSLGDKVFLWEIESPQNSVYLLGSVHTLQANDYPLPQAIYDAFDDAERLVFEIDPANLYEFSTQQAMLQAALPDHPDEALQVALSPETYALANAAALQVGLPLDVFNGFEPWFFTVTFTSLRLAQLGFDPAYGVDFSLFSDAQDAGKPISALETIEEQLAAFDTLPIQTQTRLVEQTLADLDRLESSVHALVDAWGVGDVDTFEQLILESFVDYPDVYTAVLSQRNQNWLPAIESFINQPDDYLVVVGAAHLVGDDSVIQLLEEKGYTVQQLSSTDVQ